MAVVGGFDFHKIILLIAFFPPPPFTGANPYISDLSIG